MLVAAKEGAIVSTSCTRSHVATSKQKKIIPKIRKICPLKPSYVAPRDILRDWRNDTLTTCIPKHMIFGENFFYKTKLLILKKISFDNFDYCITFIFFGIYCLAKFEFLKKNVFLRSRHGFLFLEIVLMQVFSKKA